MRLPSPFPREDFERADEQFAALIAPQNDAGFTLYAVGRNWVRMVPSRANGPVAPAVMDRTWFTRGVPEFVVVGVGAEDIVVHVAGPAVEEFDPGSGMEPVARIALVPGDGAVMRRLTQAVHEVGEVARTKFTWCSECGVFGANALGPVTLCLACDDLRAGRVY